MPKKELIIPELKQFSQHYQNLLINSGFTCEAMYLFGLRDDFKVLMARKKSAPNYMIFPLSRDTKDQDAKELMESYYLSLSVVKKVAENYASDDCICVLPVAKWSLADQGGELPIACIFLSTDHCTLFDPTALQEVEPVSSPCSVFSRSRSDSSLSTSSVSELRTLNIANETIDSQLPSTDACLARFDEILKSNSLTQRVVHSSSEQLFFKPHTATQEPSILQQTLTELGQILLS
ncbi:MAG: hypothetical protein CK426_06115 [Legionella sp.]|nr:MAG: hypothetical protein CK423_02335 [Legionella sp.]PJD98469.1 MAG: hypothetical protein CK426_06115 [Legionella sp.]